MIPITDVTLYEDRAQIIRKKTISFTEGVHTLRVEDISALIVRKSVQVSFSSSLAKVNFFDISRAFQKNKLMDTERVQEAIRWKQEEVQAKELRSVKEQVYTRYKELHQRIIQEVFLEATWGQGTPQKWRAKEEKIREKKRQALQEYQEAQREYDFKRERCRLADWVKASDALHEYAHLNIELYVSEPVDVEVSVSYIVPNACWRPSHRITYAQGQIHFDIGAMIWQNTGIDWDDVSVQFSTQRNAFGSKAPQLEIDRLSVINTSKKIVIEEREQEIHRAGEVTVESKMPGIDDGGESRLLKSPQDMTIPSNGKPYFSFIQTFSSEMTSELLLVADQIPAAILKSTQSNHSSIPILPGPVELIKNGGYIGMAKIDFVSPKEEFVIGWGAVPDIRIQRKTEYKKEEGSFLRHKNIEHHVVHLFFSNIGEKEQQINCVERIPVSELTQVRISQPDTETFCDVRPTFDAENGFLSWKQMLPKGAHIKQTYTYTINKDNSVVS